MKKQIALMILMGGIALSFSGCRQEAEVVNENLSKEADNFNSVRQLTVINGIKEEILFQMTGRMSIKADWEDNQLEILVEHDKGKYKKHFVGLSDNVSYIVEDITGNEASQYQYIYIY